MSAQKYPDIKVQLSGLDGNAFSVMGQVIAAMRRKGVEKAEIDAFREQATSGDYENLLATCVRWVDCR